MLRIDFLKKYKRIIHIRNFGKYIENASQKNGEKPVASYATLQAKINRAGELDFRMDVAEKLADLLRESGVRPRKQLSGEELKKISTLHMKPFVEFALLPDDLWAKISAGQPLSSPEQKRRKEMAGDVCTKIYQKRDLSPEIQKKLGEGLAKLSTKF